LIGIEGVIVISVLFMDDESLLPIDELLFVLLAVELTLYM